jgi:hypothetical protein
MKGWIWDFYTVERWRSAGNAVVVKMKEWIINTNKTDHHNITEILFKVALYTLTLMTIRKIVSHVFLFEAVYPNIRILQSITEKNRI